MIGYCETGGAQTHSSLCVLVVEISKHEVGEVVSPNCDRKGEVSRERSQSVEWLVFKYGTDSYCED